MNRLTWQRPALSQLSSGEEATFGGVKKICKSAFWVEGTDVNLLGKEWTTRCGDEQDQDVELVSPS